MVLAFLLREKLFHGPDIISSLCHRVQYIKQIFHEFGLNVKSAENYNMLILSWIKLIPFWTRKSKICHLTKEFIELSDVSNVKMCKLCCWRLWSHKIYMKHIKIPNWPWMLYAYWPATLIFWPFLLTVSVTFPALLIQMKDKQHFNKHLHDDKLSIYK